jgi:GNAT superfamily N-acetyltransferase
LTEVIHEGLAMFNVAQTGVANWHPVQIFLKDSTGEVMGGLLGVIWAGWMFVSMLWLRESIRGSGYGSKLMLAAEQHAIEKGCANSYLDTHSWQARPFYEKLGYEVFATLEDFPVGHKKFFLRKRLIEKR